MISFYILFVLQTGGFHPASPLRIIGAQYLPISNGWKMAFTYFSI
jgi:hypothetical protein